MKVIDSKDKRFSELCETLFLEGRLHPLDSVLSRSFYASYWEDFEFEELSFAVEFQDACCIVFISSKKKNGGECELGCYGLPMYYVESRSMSSELRTKAEKVIRKLFLQIVEAEKPVSVLYQSTRDQPTVSPLAVVLLENGGKPEVVMTQLIDLSQDEVVLKRQVRKSFRSGIAWGAKNIEMLVLDHSNIRSEHIDAFHRLHVAVAGRQTRSSVTWDIQMKMVEEGEAFIVFGYLDSELVTAALFQYNEAICYYGVSASDRSLFDKPISHGVLWTAILHAKSLSVKLFEMGEQYYSGQTRGGEFPSTKEMNIAKFKRGFGGETYSLTRVTWSCA